MTPDLARAIMRTNTTAIGAVMVYRDEADSMICGTFGQYLWHLNYVRQLLGTQKLHPVGALSLMILEDGPLFIADTHIHAQPSPDEIAETVIATARHMKRFRGGAQHRAVFGQPVRQSRQRQRAAHAGRAGNPGDAGVQLCLRGRDECRQRARPRAAGPHLPQLATSGHGQRAGLRLDRRGRSCAQHPEDAGEMASRSARS